MTDTKRPMTPTEADLWTRAYLSAIAGCAADPSGSVVSERAASLANRALEDARGRGVLPRESDTDPTKQLTVALAQIERRPAPPCAACGHSAADHPSEDGFDRCGYPCSGDLCTCPSYTMPTTDWPPPSDRRPAHGHRSGCIPGETPSAPWGCVPGCNHDVDALLAERRTLLEQAFASGRSDDKFTRLGEIDREVRLLSGRSPSDLEHQRLVEFAMAIRPAATAFAQHPMSRDYIAAATTNSMGVLGDVDAALRRLAQADQSMLRAVESLVADLLRTVLEWGLGKP